MLFLAVDKNKRTMRNMEIDPVQITRKVNEFFF